MTTGACIAELLEKTLKADPWHGPATMDILRGMSAEAAADRPVGDTHSVWELVLHMTAWQREVLDRLKGKPPSEPCEGDWPRAPSPSGDAWARACRDLETSLHELADYVSRLKPEDLAVQVGVLDRPLGSGVSRAEMVIGILQHNAYHSGQAALLRRALGAHQSE